MGTFERVQLQPRQHSGENKGDFIRNIDGAPIFLSEVVLEFSARSDSFNLTLTSDFKFQ